MDYIKLFEALNKNRPEHAIFSASGSDRWMKCLGWYKATKDLPYIKSGKAAQRGTEAHTLMDQCIKQDKLPEELSKDIELNDWVGYVLDFITASKYRVPHLQVFSEVYFPYGVNSGGTTDVIGIDPGVELILADLKTGIYAVEVENNAQLLNYAVAVRSHLGLFKNYKLVVIQPGGYHKDGAIREWNVTDKELDAFELEMNSAIDQNLEGGPRTPGDHCKYCKAEAICKSNAEYILNKIQLNLAKDFLNE